MKMLLFDSLIEEITLDTETDEVYDVFEIIAPPPDFVKQVMQKVALLPRPSLPKPPWDHFTHLVVDGTPAHSS